MQRTANEEADRILKLLDIGIEAVRAGDGDMALLILQESLATAQRLPQKPGVIYLPDRSGERL